MLLDSLDAFDASGNTSRCTQTITLAPAPGDVNADGCVDRSDVDILLGLIRSNSAIDSYDVNGDGKLNIADVRFVVVHFTNVGGSSCSP